MVADYMLRISPLGAEIGRMYLYNKLSFNLRENLNKRGKLDIMGLPA